MNVIGVMMNDFNEAQLRGINLRSLRQEAFTSQKHLSMVAEHQFRADLYWSRRRFIELSKHRPSQKRDTPKVQHQVEKTEKPDTNEPKQYRFTPEQLRIAMTVTEKMEK